MKEGFAQKKVLALFILTFSLSFYGKLSGQNFTENMNYWKWEEVGNGYYGALNSVEPYSVALTPYVDDLEDIMLNSPSLSLRALASAVLMQEGHLNFPEVSENLVASSHFDIVVYPGAVSNKKVRKAIPEKVQQYGSLSAYPNPTVGNTNLDYQFVQNPEEITIQVLTMDGRLVMQHSIKTNQPFGSMPLPLNNLGTGFYIVTLSSKAGEVVQTKLVKQ